MAPFEQLPVFSFYRGGTWYRATAVRGSALRPGDRLVTNAHTQAAKSLTPPIALGHDELGRPVIDYGGGDTEPHYPDRTYWTGTAKTA